MYDESSSSIDEKSGFGQLKDGFRNFASGLGRLFKTGFSNMRYNLPDYISNIGEWLKKPFGGEPNVSVDAAKAGLNPTEYRAGLAGVPVVEYVGRRAASWAKLNPKFLFMEQNKFAESVGRSVIESTGRSLEYLSSEHNCSVEEYVEKADGMIKDSMGKAYGAMGRSSLSDWGIDTSDGDEINVEVIADEPVRETAAEASAEQTVYDAEQTVDDVPVENETVEDKTKHDVKTKVEDSPKSRVSVGKGWLYDEDLDVFRKPISIDIPDRDDKLFFIAEVDSKDVIDYDVSTQELFTDAATKIKFDTNVAKTEDLSEHLILSLRADKFNDETIARIGMAIDKNIPGNSSIDTVYGNSVDDNRSTFVVTNVIPGSDNILCQMPVGRLANGGYIMGEALFSREGMQVHGNLSNNSCVVSVPSDTYVHVLDSSDFDERSGTVDAFYVPAKDVQLSILDSVKQNKTSMVRDFAKDSKEVEQNKTVEQEDSVEASHVSVGSGWSYNEDAKIYTKPVEIPIPGSDGDITYGVASMSAEDVSDFDASSGEIKAGGRSSVHISTGVACGDDLSDELGLSMSVDYFNTGALSKSSNYLDSHATHSVDVDTSFVSGFPGNRCSLFVSGAYRDNETGKITCDFPVGRSENGSYLMGRAQFDGTDISVYRQIGDKGLVIGIPSDTEIEILDPSTYDVESNKRTKFSVTAGDVCSSFESSVKTNESVMLKDLLKDVEFDKNISVAEAEKIAKEVARHGGDEDAVEEAVNDTKEVNAQALEEETEEKNEPVVEASETVSGSSDSDSGSAEEEADTKSVPSYSGLISEAIDLAGLGVGATGMEIIAALVTQNKGLKEQLAKTFDNTNEIDKGEPTNKSEVSVSETSESSEKTNTEKSVAKSAEELINRKLFGQVNASGAMCFDGVDSTRDPTNLSNRRFDLALQDGGRLTVSVDADSVSSIGGNTEIDAGTKVEMARYDASGNEVLRFVGIDVNDLSIDALHESGMDLVVPDSGKTVEHIGKYTSSVGSSSAGGKQDVASFEIVN